MATIINFDERRLTAPRRPYIRQGPARILFFTGVRYERQDARQPTGKAGGRKPAKRIH